MHETLGAVHFAAEDCAKCLMSETDTEHGNLAIEVFDGVRGDAVVLDGFAWSWGDHKVRRVERDELIHRHLVVAKDFDVRAEFAKVLDEVVSE